MNLWRLSHHVARARLGSVGSTLYCNELCDSWYWNLLNKTKHNNLPTKIKYTLVIFRFWIEKRLFICIKAWNIYAFIFYHPGIQYFLAQKYHFWWIQFQLSLINSMSWVKRNEFYRSKRTSIFAKIVFHIFHLSDTIYISKLILCVELVVCFAFLPADYLNWIFTSTQNRCANKQTYSSSILQINIALFLLNFESLLQSIHFNFNRFV